MKTPAQIADEIIQVLAQYRLAQIDPKPSRRVWQIERRDR